MPLLFYHFPYSISITTIEKGVKQRWNKKQVAVSMHLTGIVITTLKLC